MGNNSKMQYSELLIKRIKELCKKKGYSVNQLAKLSNVKQSTIANMMSGLTKSPGIVWLHKIANAFNMTLAEFLNFEELNNYSFDDEENDNE